MLKPKLSQSGSIKKPEIAGAQDSRNTTRNWMDTLSKAARSRLMSKVHSKNTTSEILVRRYLWANAIRYRLHYQKLPGKPDIVIPCLKLAIFIHGCFWHGHKGCPRGHLPKTKRAYWKAKIDTNRRRDRTTEKKLKDQGWHTIVIWECQLRTQKAATKTLPNILKKIIRPDNFLRD